MSRIVNLATGADIPYWYQYQYTIVASLQKSSPVPSTGTSANSDTGASATLFSSV